MAVQLNLYDAWVAHVADPTRAPVSGTLKMALVTSVYTPNKDTHDFWDDVSANEVAGAGYTAGGNACALPAWTDTGTGTFKFDADDPATWTQNASGFGNARRAILYFDTGTPSTSRLVAFSNDFGADQGNVGGDLSITFDAAGIYTGSA